VHHIVTSPFWLLLRINSLLQRIWNLALLNCVFSGARLRMVGHIGARSAKDGTDVSHSTQAAGRWTLTIGMQKRVLGLLCVVVLIIIFTAGLWPFHAPKNQVSWLSNSNGIHFGGYGVILTPGVSSFAGLKDGISRSVEIWLQPDHSDIGGTILAFYKPGNRIVAFSLHQSIDDLLLQRVTVYGQRLAKSGFYIGHVFRKNNQLFVTITSNSQDTAVYLNGALVRTFPRFGLSSEDLTGQLIVGNHPLADDGWQGQVKGLAVYNRALTEVQVLQHYNAWTTNQNAEIKNESPNSLYLFNEGSGAIVHNQLNSETDLRIPEHFFVLHAPFLKTPWAEFQASWSYVKDVLINIAGFVPFGFSFCAYFVSVRRMSQAVVATIVLGGVVSLTIEVLQAFLPTRDSGMTDIITNTLGTAVGTALYGSKSVQAIFAAVGLEGLLQPTSRDRSTSLSSTFST
jgi:VanZ like family/Concanavalin A-like lectin/glucanases superfamily